MNIQVIEPTNGNAAYIQLLAGETGVIELHPHHLKCYVHDGDLHRNIPAYPNGYDEDSKPGTLEDLIELRDAMHNQFGC